ncbi:HAD family hydrolase [Ferruginibacter lapsinanis]|uniref:HAD family hydrolase n=1 Tax=Ferruginibacter lapsinanis TaxID=563172 RepID=UPI001E592624|nr:HAD family hydrolase [Ferruginibacter lapsinanis]UEG50317.1 HAD family hydrolase [Ferruginibacter lapsinanis]
MYKVIIFDLDQTLIDSSAIEALRANRRWPKVMQSLNLINQLEDLKKLVIKLHNASIKIGIVTNSPSTYAKGVLQHFGIPYDALVAFHDVSLRKPNPEAFNLIMKKLNVSSQDCLNVGDHDNDILAGQRANITSIGVKWHSNNYTFSTKPENIFLEPKELANFLNVKI